MVSQMFQNLTLNLLFSFNKNIYSASAKIFSFNKNIYSTSTTNNFIQQQSSRIFKMSSFNKIPRPSPVKYKTTLSHASNISHGLKFIPAPEIHSCSGASYLIGLG